MTIFLIRKYLTGNCTEEEKCEVEAYLADESADQSLLEEALHLSWDENAVGGDEQVKETVLKQLHYHILNPNTTVLPARSGVVRLLRSPGSKWWYASAAALVIAAFAAVLYLGTQDANPASGAPQVAEKWKTIINNERTVQQTVLPDSTRVWMSPGARLSYAPNSYAHERKTQLEGEAFFDVTEDPHHPFSIATGSVVTKVLGTAFNVEAYAKEKAVKVSLVRGKVTLQHEDPKSHAVHAIDTLMPGQMISCDKRNYSVTRETFKPDNMDNWLKGYVVFQEVPLSDALQRLAVRFRLTIQIDKNIHLEHKRVTAIFREEPAEQILDNLLFIADCTWRRNGNTIEVIKAIQ